MRYAADTVLYRALYVGDLPGKDRERSVVLSGGVDLTYRLNRGDIQTIREVWVEECYRPPVEVPLNCVVDLGANIATTSLWYGTLGATRFVCVEPDAENARLARRNLQRNHIRAEVLEAAVGARDGSAAFRADRSANLGRVGEGDERVRMVSMRTVLERIPDGVPVDLVKMDIDGGEGGVLRGDLGWLDRVRCLIVEFHPDLVDYEGTDPPPDRARLSLHPRRRGSPELHGLLYEGGAVAAPEQSWWDGDPQYDRRHAGSSGDRQPANSSRAVGVSVLVDR